MTQNPQQTAPEAAIDESMRLNRFLARAGVASRRKSDDLIRRGAVRVNGEVVLQPGCSVVVGQDRVECKDVVVVLPAAYEYILMCKPAGHLVTRVDMRGRPTVFDLLEEAHPGTVAVGRLDFDTTGLLLLTDDGELAFRLMHPRFGVEKRYRAQVAGTPRPTDLEQLRRGIELEDGKTAPARVQILERAKGKTHLELCLHEGRKRQVKRMCKAIGHRVLALERTAFAGHVPDGLKPGQCRHLKAAEVQALRTLVGLDAANDGGP